MCIILAYKNKQNARKKKYYEAAVLSQAHGAMQLLFASTVWECVRSTFAPILRQNWPLLTAKK